MMNDWIQVCLIILFTSTIAVAKNQCPQEKQGLQILQSFSAEDFQKDKKTLQKQKSNADLKINQMFSTLQDCLPILQKKETSDLFFAEISRVAHLTLQQDGTFYAFEILWPAYEKFNKKFEKSWQLLPAPLNKKVKESFESYKVFKREGNG